MKNKILILSVAVLLSVDVANSQCNNALSTTAGGGTTNYLTKFTTSVAPYCTGNSLIQDNGTNVGIGAAGSYKLDVSGDMNVAQGNAYRMAGNKILWYNSTATSNIFAGVSAGANITGGINNTALGYAALSTQQTTSNDNTAIGSGALQSFNDAAGNGGVTAVGSGALATVTSYGFQCTAVGYKALNLMNSSAIENTAVGSRALEKNTSGNWNTAMGDDALWSNTTAGGNSAFGTEALEFNVNANSNVAIGYQALNKQSFTNSGTGWESHNVAVGWRALYWTNAVASTTEGINNTALGYNAGGNNSTGYNNTFIGYGADNTLATTINNAAAIGANTVVKFSNNMVLGDNNTKVGINLSSSASAILSPLSVGGVGNTLFTGYFYNSTSTSSGANGIRGEIAAPTAAGVTTYATAGVNTPGTAGISVGVVGAAYRTTAADGANAYGVYGYAGNTFNGYNYGVYGYLLGTRDGAGVYGSTSGTTLITGQYAGFFKGDIRVTTDNAMKATTNTWQTASDARLKNNIASFTDGLNVIRQINPVTYQFTGAGGLPTGTNIGVLAQDVQPVAPYCVGSTKLAIKQSEAAAFSNDIVSTFQDSIGTTMNTVNILTFNTHGLFYAMLNSIKQLDSTITAMKSTAGQRTNSCDDSQGKAETTLEVELANNSEIILYQNEPNPFDGSTVIRYFIPENISGAYIGFYDMYGKEIKNIQITEKGFGKIEASTENLASGIYSYSIIVNDKTIDTKKMLKTK